MDTIQHRQQPLQSPKNQAMGHTTIPRIRLRTQKTQSRNKATASPTTHKPTPRLLLANSLDSRQRTKKTIRKLQKLPRNRRTKRNPPPKHRQTQRTAKKEADEMTICAWKACKRLSNQKNAVKVGNHRLEYCGIHLAFVEASLKEGSQTKAHHNWVNNWHKRRFKNEAVT